MRNIVVHSMRELEAEIARVAVDWRAINLRPFLGGLSSKLERLHDNYFQSETGPGPRRWPELAPSTIAAKGHNTILVDTGRLKASLVGQTADSVREAFQENDHAWLHWGTDVEYSSFHDEEAQSLPQRPHVGLAEKDVDAIAGEVLDYQVDQMKELMLI